MEAKQATIDSIHMKLRDASAALGEERRRLEGLQERKKRREEQKLKIANLTRAVQDERAKLMQLQQQYGQINNNETEMKLGDADKGLAIPTLPENILSNINPNSHQPQVLDQAQRQLLASLPSTHVLRARLAAYTANNEALSNNVQSLQSKSTELIAKYRKIISLCTRVDEDKIDSLLDNLVRAVESEPSDVELPRVREFLSRVDGV